MMDAVIAAGERLAEALRAENEALAALDLTRAAAMATRKVQATDAFAAATAAATRVGARAEGGLRQVAERLATDLGSLGQQNRKLLEEAIALQSRVIETIAVASRPAAHAPGYGRQGRHRPGAQAAALAVVTRA
ncbi:hypothetical protein [Roseococcus microcysteis]|uniref:hypothetical protein n=1 Tax=Roseococcus microcysteis TaxID=2771361 RepID=UPI00168AF185|nr:hypothetical protein [Roseococcus microcysteis]